MVVNITTRNCIYQFLSLEDNVGVLKGGRIKGEKGVQGYWITSVQLNQTAVFVTLEPCTLVYGTGEEVNVLEMSAIRVTKIEKIEEV